MWWVKFHQISTKLCSFFKHLSKSVISCLSKSSIYGSINIYCISLSIEFGTKVFRSLVEKRVKAENCLSTFAVEGVTSNGEIFMSFTEFPFYKQTG